MFFEREPTLVAGDILAATKRMFGKDSPKVRFIGQNPKLPEYQYRIEDGVTLSFADGTQDFNEEFPRGYTFEEVRGFLAKWVYLCDKGLIQLSQNQYPVLDHELVEGKGRSEGVIRIVINEGDAIPVEVQYGQAIHTYTVRVPRDAKVLDVRSRLAQAMGLWTCQVAIFVLDDARQLAKSTWDAGVASGYKLEVVPCSRKVYFREKTSRWTRDRNFEERLDSDVDLNFSLFQAKIAPKIGHSFVMMFEKHWINGQYNLLFLRSSASSPIKLREAKKQEIPIGDEVCVLDLCGKILIGDLKRYICRAYGPVAQAIDVTRCKQHVLNDNSKLKDIKGQLKVEMEYQISVNCRPLYVSRQDTIQTVKEKLGKGNFRAFSKTAELPSDDLASKYSEIFVVDPEKLVQCQVLFDGGGHTAVWADYLPGKTKMKDILDRSVRERFPALSVSDFELFWQRELLGQDRLLATISPEIVELHAERIVRSFPVHVTYQRQHWDMQFRMNRHQHVRDLLELVQETLSSPVRHGLARDADQELTFLNAGSLPVQVTCEREPSLQFCFYDEKRQMETPCSGIKMDATILDLAQHLNFQQSAPAILVDGQRIAKNQFEDALLRHLVFRKDPISFSCESKPQASTMRVQPQIVVPVQPKKTSPPRPDPNPPPTDKHEPNVKPQELAFLVTFPDDSYRENEMFSRDSTIKDVWDREASGVSKVQDRYKAIKYGILYENAMRRGDETLGEPTERALDIVGMLDVYVIRDGSLSANPIDACFRHSLDDFCRSHSLDTETLASGGIICTKTKDSLHELSSDNVVILSVVREPVNIKVQIMGGEKDYTVDGKKDYTVGGDGDATVFSLLGRLLRTVDDACVVSDDTGRIGLQTRLKDIKGVMKVAREHGTSEPPKEKHFWFTFNDDLIKITLPENACARSAKEKIALLYDTIEEFVVIIFLGRVIPDEMVLGALDIPEGHRFTVVFRNPTGYFLEKTIEKRYNEAKTHPITPKLVRPDEYPELVEKLLKECPGTSRETCKRIFNWCEYNYDAAKAHILGSKRV